MEEVLLGMCLEYKPMCIDKKDVLKVIDVLEEIGIERINDLRN